MALIRTPANKSFQCKDLNGFKLVTTSRLGLSHHCKHKFNHVFKMPYALFVALWTYASIQKLYLISFSKRESFLSRVLISKMSEINSQSKIKNNFWLCITYKKNSWTVHFIFFDLFSCSNLFSRPPIVDIVQGDCYFNICCGTSFYKQTATSPWIANC